MARQAEDNTRWGVCTGRPWDAKAEEPSWSYWTS